MLNTQNKKRSFSGFTLVELIVVITILVILGTIAFISLAGFSGSARDSSRVSDLTNLSKGLEISFIKSSAYPTPDNAFSVTYSGGILWNQGTIGTSVTNLIGANGAKISRRPTDPLDATKEYAYSILAFGNGYQIKTDYEADNITRRSESLIDQASAASGNPAISYLKGNYNGVVAKTQTGNTLYVIATPSIITSQTGAAGSKFDIMTALTNKFLVHGSTNSGGIIYAARLVFSSTLLPNTNADRIVLASNVANSYSGTSIASQPSIAPYISALASNNTESLASLGGWLVVSLWGAVLDPVAVVSPFVSCTAAGQTYAAGTTYPGSAGFPGACSEADRVLCTGNGTGQIWSMCNIGATTTANYNSSSNDRTALTNVDGKLFQFARNDGFGYGTNPTISGGSAVATSIFTWEVPTNWYYAGISSNNDWRTTQLSISTDPGANIWTSSPCDANYHVPTGNEFQSAYTAFSNANYGNALNLPTVLKMPLSGLRNYPTAVLDYPGMMGYYWSSSPSTTKSYILSFFSSSVNLWNESRAVGSSVRCIKN